MVTSGCIPCDWSILHLLQWFVRLLWLFDMLRRLLYRLLGWFYRWLLSLIDRGRCFIWWCSKLRLKGHHTLVWTEVSNWCITHSQMILRGDELPTVITHYCLVRGRLKVDPIQRQAVQWTKQLVFVVCIYPFNHVKVAFLRITPSTCHYFLFLWLEFVDTYKTTESFLLSLELDKLGRSVREAVCTTIITGA